jgi:septum formation protein
VLETVVAFNQFTAAEIYSYVASGEGLGKAGGYAIQGRAEALIRFISGSHSSVVGLPLFETRALLLASGLTLG